MYTKCPECQAIFRVTTEQLSMADGLVRCGICDGVFNGHDHVEKNHSPSDYFDHINPQANSQANSQAISDSRQLDKDAWPVDEYASEHQYEQQIDDDTLTDAERIPTVIRDDFGGNILTKTNSPIQIAVFTLSAIALAIFFLGQLSYWQNLDILPRTWVNSFCNTVGCGENNKRDLSALKILNRNIYTHPNVDKALMITASFVNQNLSAQDYPLLEVTLLDTHGQIIAVRRFSPKDYLVNKSLGDTLMPPNQPVGARLEVLDPGNEVIAYEFQFR